MLTHSLLHIDALSITMICLVIFIGLSVGCFARKYLSTDRNRRSFFFLFIALVSGICLMTASDNLVLFVLSSLTSNLLLARLMMHKKEWPAARSSALLAVKYLSSGFVCLVIALGLLSTQANSLSIQSILHHTPASHKTLVAGIFLLLAAICQSALWPCHKWLTSSLNSPTPVSALMHAGVINGGGFLLARFSPLLFQTKTILVLVFIAGITTAIIGSLWKLIQSDIKRMLACSTMAQMGFMIMQCGLGLFPAAIAHLCWHGLFKASAFLHSGSAAKENRFDLTHSPLSALKLLLATLCACLASILFISLSHTSITLKDTSIFLFTLAFLTALQVAITILRSQIKYSFLLASTASVVAVSLYGLSVRGMEYVFKPMHISHPQTINMIHILGLSTLIASWIIFSLIKNKTVSKRWQKLIAIYYVRLLNASQPHYRTVTASRNDYRH